VLGFELEYMSKTSKYCDTCIYVHSTYSVVNGVLECNLSWMTVIECESATVSVSVTLIELNACAESASHLVM